jgi:hypothetical protein
VWSQEEDIDVLTSTGLQELVSVMGAKAIQQEQVPPRVPDLSSSLRDRRENISLAHSSNKSIIMKEKSDPSLKTFIFTRKYPHNVPARKFALNEDAKE